MAAPQDGTAIEETNQAVDVAMLRFSLCQRNKARGIMTWFARVFDTETKEIRYVSLHTTKKTEASGILAAKIQDGSFEKKDASSVTLRKAVESYVESMEARKLKRGSIRSVELAFLGIRQLMDRPVASITKNELLEAFSASVERVSAGTHNLRRTCIKTAFKHFVNVLEIIPSNTADVLPARKNVRKERPFWTPQQVERLLDETDDANRRLLWALMAFAGLRISEALAFKKEDVRDGCIYVVGKGDKPAKVPISARLYMELDRCGWNWDFSGINRSTHSLGVAAKNAFPEGFDGSSNNHRLRHSFASNLLRNRCNPKSAQVLLRHSQITTTLQIYSHVIEDDLREDVEKAAK